MKSNILFAFLFLISFALQGQNKLSLPKTIDIRLFSNVEIEKISITGLEGQYYIYSDKKVEEEFTNLRRFSSVKLKAENNKVQLFRNNDLLFESDEIYIRGHDFTNVFLINPVSPKLLFRIYDDDLVLTANNGRLKIINNVALEKYIAGVVQSESGFLRHNIYYQAQATIARTYALKNINRHEAEGFNLCDQVHCQAYYGRTGYNPIIEAVAFSKGSIIVDENNIPLNTVYHANCGGETINSEDLWSNPLPYLKSVKDTFCINSPGAAWEAKISKSDFFDFIENNFRINLSEKKKEAFRSFSQKNRKIYLDDSKSIHLRHIRENFGLRSTFFDITSNNDSLIFTGKGYGHGVGLCQEGAIEMARLGFTKEFILNFYYQNISIIILDD